jgi:hypothetical protein
MGGGQEGQAREVPRQSARHALRTSPDAHDHARSQALSPKVEGEVRIERPSKGPNDGFDVDQVIWMTDKGAFYTVIETGKVRGDEDMGYYAEWYVWARLRPSTAAESATATARRTEAQRRAALAAIPDLIAGLVRQGAHYTTESVPADAWRYSLHATISGSETLFASEDAVWFVTSNYDDGPHTWRLPVDAVAVAAVAEAIAGLT